MLSAVIRQEGRAYTAWTPELDVASQGHTIEQALANLREAVELYLEDEEAPAIGEAAFLTTFEVHHGAKAPRAVGA